jgi:hypothetical protein
MNLCNLYVRFFKNKRAKNCPNNEAKGRDETYKQCAAYNQGLTVVSNGQQLIYMHHSIALKY